MKNSMSSVGLLLVLVAALSLLRLPGTTAAPTGENKLGWWMPVPGADYCAMNCMVILRGFAYQFCNESPCQDIYNKIGGPYCEKLCELKPAGDGEKAPAHV